MANSRELYSILMLLATLVAVSLVRRHQTRLAITPLQKLGIAIGGLIGATLAAKLPFVLGANPDYGLLAAWLSDGKTLLWGLVGGYIGVEIAKWSLHVTTSTGDTFVVPVAVAVAIGRIGCFLYGCCYGIATNQQWGIRFAAAPDGGRLLRHPAQLYEFAFHLSFALIAWCAIADRRRNARGPDQNSFVANRHGAGLRGNWMPIYLISYSTYRFISETWRPEASIFAGLTFYQLSALAIACGFLLLILSRHVNASRRIDRFGH